MRSRGRLGIASDLANGKLLTRARRASRQARRIGVMYFTLSNYSESGHGFVLLHLIGGIWFDYLRKGLYSLGWRPNLYPDCPDVLPKLRVPLEDLNAEVYPSHPASQAKLSKSYVRSLHCTMRLRAALSKHASSIGTHRKTIPRSLSNSMLSTKSSSLRF